MGDYTEPDIWGFLGSLPDEGAPTYAKITPIHLAASCSFLGVSRTEFDYSLAGLSIKGDNLDNLCQEPTAEADGNSCKIHAMRE